jgi:predicted anti-sigma-YlaC factor YlaD
MRCDEIRELLAGYQDGELDAAQAAQVRDHLAGCESCRAELARLNKVKEVASKVQYKDLPLEVWEGYWQGVYRRIERGMGWIFASLGAVILICFGLFHLVRDFFLRPEISIFPKLGVAGLIVGGAFLLVSLIRERMFAYHRDRYREVQR